MASDVDILIVGGGVIGLSTAWYLSGEARVAVLDQGEMGRQASWAGAGIIPPASAAHAQTPIAQLRAHSAALFPILSAELRERTGIDNGYLRCGGVEVPDPDARDEPLPTEEWHGEGMDYTLLDRAELTRRIPGLAADIDQGVWLPGIAQVRNPWHLRALQAGCLARGVVLYPDWPVRRLVLSGTRVLGVEGEAKKLGAERILIAAGAWSDDLLRQVGWTPGIRPVRGQIALLATGQEGIRPILMQGKRYLVPRPDGRILVGSTEEEAGFDARVTAGGIAGLLELATRLVPALADATLERSWAGLRPGSQDGLPYLGRVPGWDNLYVAAGHFRAGLQLSAASGLVMARCLLEQPTGLSLDAFRLDRPAVDLADQTAFRS